MFVPNLESPRLTYGLVASEDLDGFHALVVDPHIRRYLMDGRIFERSWAQSAIEASRALFAERQVGLWLVREHRVPEPIGFCGFHVFEAPDPEPQLLYAFRERHTGRGYATEATRALLDRVTQLGWKRVVTAVDEPNTASIRVLQRFDFAEISSFPGAFGRALYFARTLSAAHSR
jgi:RimJ/RimL family protein N-acetyltransferase